jgi:DNA-binding CsgD family transcriptional regulator
MLVHEFADIPIATPRDVAREMHESTNMGLHERTFTAQDLQILSWILAGKTDRDIGELMGLSAKTVNYHVEKMKQRLQVGTRVQLVVAAIYWQLGAASDVCAVLSQSLMGLSHDLRDQRSVG